MAARLRGEGRRPAAAPSRTPDDRFLESSAFTSLSPDGRTLFYCNNLGDIERRHVWKVATAGGESVQLTKGDGIETYPVPLASGTQVAMLAPMPGGRSRSRSRRRQAEP